MIEPRAGLYVYAVIGGHPVLPTGLRGLEDQEIQRIAVGDLAAIVSEIPNRRIRPEQRHLAAHHKVLAGLLEQATVLPIAFGTISTDSDVLANALRHNYRDLLSQIQRFADKVELSLRVSWQTANVFEFFVSRHGELRQERDRLFVPGKAPSRAAKIAIGKLFEKLLEQDRSATGQKLVSLLEREGVEIQANRCRNECDAANLSVLVDRSRLAWMSERVSESAANFDENYAIALSGPFPPHSFVRVSLALPSPGGLDVSAG